MRHNIGSIDNMALTRAVVLAVLAAASCAGLAQSPAPGAPAGTSREAATASEALRKAGQAARDATDAAREAAGPHTP